MTKPRLIAFYLPQYHPIPENDEWWGKGFTEWTNVAKAKPLFKGHYQPHLPADLGFYDLRVPEVREQQAELARNAGIEGFCYYHYWFAGKQLLERPFNEVLASGKPDFPFCLCWANESWTGKWHGAPNKTLISQTYPGPKDHERHFYSLLPYFFDSRTITIEGKPVFIIYNPQELPNSKQFCDQWRELGLAVGLKGLVLLGWDSSGIWDYKKSGFDGAIINDFIVRLSILNHRKRGLLFRAYKKVFKRNLYHDLRRLMKLPESYNYFEFIQQSLGKYPLDDNQYPSVVPNWDNTPRSGTNGLVLKGSSPELFSLYLANVLTKIQSRDHYRKLVFIKSWNEWAEGNYLEPDQKFGHGFLDALREAINEQEGSGAQGSSKQIPN